MFDESDERRIKGLEDIVDKLTLENFELAKRIEALEALQ